MQKLSYQQAQAISTIGKWLKDKQQPYITLGGYAGTGKTTVISALRKILSDNQPDMKLAFCAYTGKATQVLKKHLNQHKTLSRKDTVSTLHGLMYYSNSKADQPISWRKKDKLNYDLVIVDEASMLSEDLWLDLLSFNIPVIAVGDHGQLPPINSDFNLMAEPEIRLEQIFRQSVDSPIIKLATQARIHGAIEIDNYSEKVQKLNRADAETGDKVEQILISYNSNNNLVLCGYNHTRHKLNKYIRKLKDFDSEDPQVGDVIVCLRNSRESGLSNGQVGTIRAISEADNDPKNAWWYISADFDGTNFEGYAPREQFHSLTTMSRLPKRKKTDLIGLFDFGYALTVHKAQGSQANKVLVFEERFSSMDDEQWRRWLYTAVTRAEEELYIVGN